MEEYLIDDFYSILPDKYSNVINAKSAKKLLELSEKYLYKAIFIARNQILGK